MWPPAVVAAADVVVADAVGQPIVRTQTSFVGPAAAAVELRPKNCLRYYYSIDCRWTNI